MAATEHPTPGPKIPEHLSTTKPARSREEKIDRQMEDSFPASDPPSFSGGNHIIGAPKERESDTPSGTHHDVVKAEERVKKGNAAKPEKY
ncbi:MAG TPA: hypothetical protein VN723_07455 [Rhizomicrobium sp.]|jgi:hypothetical protein|nr:hypothetical protein [Rhizomicrobium sp.]